MSTSAYVKTIQGPQGPQGPTGIQGATGIQGPTGPAGTQVITGTGVLDFGSAPGSSWAEVNITGQSFITSASAVNAWMYGTTASHNEIEHQIADIKVSPGAILPGTGFRVVASSNMRWTGQFAIRWMYTP